MTSMRGILGFGRKSPAVPTVLSRAFDAYPWIATLAAAIGLWLGIVAMSGRSSGGVLASAAVLAVFFVTVGIGQMFVIAAGNGNVDLSIPYVMTLAGFVSLNYMSGTDGRLAQGLVAGIVVGLIVGFANFVVIRALLIPPIVATLSVGFIVETAAIRYSHSSAGKTPSPALQTFTVERAASVPVMPLAFLGVAILFAVVLNRTVYGRRVLAYGQSARAARLANIPTNRVLAICYMLSGALAGVAGTLLATYAGGANLGMADLYQLGSIAVVVLGGSSIAGGRANVTGLWSAAMFLTLLTDLLNVARLGADWQDMVQGLVIIAVLAAFGNRRATQ